MQENRAVGAEMESTSVGDLPRDEGFVDVPGGRV
jgi:hypothetical protein